MCLIFASRVKYIISYREASAQIGESETQDKEGSEKEDIDFVEFQVYAKAKKA